MLGCIMFVQLLYFLDAIRLRIGPMTKDSPLDTSHNAIEARWSPCESAHPIVWPASCIRTDCTLCDSIFARKPEQKSGPG